MACPSSLVDNWGNEVGEIGGERGVEKGMKGTGDPRREGEGGERGKWEQVGVAIVAQGVLDMME